MFRSSTIIRELVLSLAEVIFMLKHSVKLRRYVCMRLCGSIVPVIHIIECISWTIKCLLLLMHGVTMKIDHKQLLGFSLKIFFCPP